MRRARKWVLVMIGLPVLGVAVLWIDAYDRAVAAIDAEDARLRSDIAAFRARRRPLYPVDEIGAVDGLPCPSILFRRSEPIDIEDGRLGQDLLNLLIAQQAASRMPKGFYTSLSSFPHKRVLTIDDAIRALAVTQETLPQCGYGGASIAESFEEEALEHLPRPLTRPDRPPTSAELRRLADALDRMLASRRTIEEVLEAEYLIDRSEALRVLHLRADPTGFIVRPPGWKEFFSWRILIVKCLKELDDHYRAAVKAKGSFKIEAPVPEAREQFHARTRSQLLISAEGVLLWNRQVLARWQLARVATAVARFKGDRGREPTQLTELVPEYLPQVPANPLGEEPIQLKNGELQAVSVPGGPELVWETRRP